MHKTRIFLEFFHSSLSLTISPWLDPRAITDPKSRKWLAGSQHAALPATRGALSLGAVSPRFSGELVLQAPRCSGPQPPLCLHGRGHPPGVHPDFEVTLQSCPNKCKHLTSSLFSNLSHALIGESPQVHSFACATQKTSTCDPVLTCFYLLMGPTQGSNVFQKHLQEENHFPGNLLRYSSQKHDLLIYWSLSC